MATIEPPSLLDCPVCCDKYKNPKMISCGHTFCLDPCLRNLVQSSSPNCPLCRIPIQVPSSGKVDDLPTNFVLQSMLEVQTANINESPVAQKKNNNTGPSKQKICSTHDEDFVYYCPTCSELLCPKCLDESHNKDHDTLQLQEAVERYCGVLVPVEKDLMDVTKKSKEICLFLEDAKQRCKQEGDKIRGKIDEAEEMAIQEVRKRKVELYLELDKKETNKLKYLEDLTEKAVELSLFSESTHDMCGKIKLELTQLEFQKKSAIKSVSKKTTSLLKDVSHLENEAFKDSEPITFQPNEEWKPMPLGILNDQSVDDKKLGVLLFKVKALQYCVPSGYSYTGSTLLSANSIVFLSQLFHSQNYNVCVCYRTGEKERTFYTGLRGGHISNELSVHMDKTKTKFLFLEKKSTPLEVTFNESDMTVSENRSVTLGNKLLYQINALSWDERGEHCYALLSDDETIKTFTFTPEKREQFHVKLDRKVKCSHSRGFHVSQFGMAIFDEPERRVLFFESSNSPRPTRAVVAPSERPDWHPSYVTSLQKNRKWYVLWKSPNSGASRVFQYSSSFDKECMLLSVDLNITTFSVLDGNYLSIDTWSPSKAVPVSVYQIERS